MVLEAEWDSKKKTRVRTNRAVAVFGMVTVGVMVTPAAAIGNALASGFDAALLAGGVAMLFGIPLIFISLRVTEGQEGQAENRMRQLTRELSDALDLASTEAKKRDSEARRQQFESRLANALDMAEGEVEVVGVIQNALSSVLPDSSAELLLADNSHAHLQRMVAIGPDPDNRGCSVDSPDHCPAARRAQIQVFPNSHALDACPKLRQQPGEARSGLCVPVSIMGRTVGVIHSTGEADAAVPDEQVHDLATLAKLSGTRMGMLRAMAESQLQAATDTLTGLLNRRAFEQKVSDMRRDRMPLTIAMVDLDHFKQLNDTYGHETGDRALRLFSRILRESLRADDLVCRYGGEEFALAFPGCQPTFAARALETVRTRLDAATTVNGVPGFTASFGVTELQAQEDLPSCLRRADTALFYAKNHGRDQVVLQDGEKTMRAIEADDIDLLSDLDGPSLG